MGVFVQLVCIANRTGPKRVIGKRLHCTARSMSPLLILSHWWNLRSSLRKDSFALDFIAKDTNQLELQRELCKLTEIIRFHEETTRENFKSQKSVN